MSHDGDTEDFQVLITADEAWPAFERTVLNAQTEILAGFRLFDFSTRLRSDDARAIGETWFDLIEHVVARGVTFRLVISDFDPVMATPLHEACWRCKRQAAALAEILGPQAAARLTVIAAMHPARAGLLPRLAFLPAVLRRKSSVLEATSPAQRARQAIGLSSDSLPDLHTVSHHQKLAVIDRRHLYIGGLDLNERRYDTPTHDRPAKDTWSDVQVLTTGPAAEEAARHLETFLADIVDGTAPAKTKHLSRTLSASRALGFWALSPRTLVNEIEEDHIAAFGRARHLIHIETQFVRSSRLADALAAVGRRNPDLGLILVLPGLPEDVAFEGNRGIDARYGLSLQSSALDTIQDAFGTRAAIATPVQPRFAARDDITTHAGAPLIHLHNKVLVIDDDWAMVGSANLNGRSMRWDTEAALRISDPRHVGLLRSRLIRHWWPDGVPEEAVTITTAAKWWRTEIQRNHVRRPDARKGLLVPHDPDVVDDLEKPLPGVTENIV